ncbi:MAG TPA: YqaE/Pmp3 family membrane protein [Bacteroidia bacterium]|nr:YqaE/Pmp3 family membrane protein [Bacteroidia bacterium]
MKKLFTSSALLLAGAVMVTIVGHAQSISITKRHYTGGYYIDFGNKKKAVSKTETSQPAQQNVASIETKLVNSIPVVSNEVPMQMNMVAVNNISVKREKTKKHAAINVITKSANVEVNNTTNVFSPVSDDSITKVSATESSSNAAGMPLILLVIITILIPFLGVGLAKGVHFEFWLDLILTLLFYLPGLIYGLIVILGNS